MKLEFIDIKRVYLQADVKMDICVELPMEDREEGKCARLRKAMYGTAAQSWEPTYRKAHDEWGFKLGRASPCVMHHVKRNIRLVVHGDDFTALGKEEDLDCYRNRITSEMEATVKGELAQERET